VEDGAGGGAGGVATAGGSAREDMVALALALLALEGAVVCEGKGAVMVVGGG